MGQRDLTNRPWVVHNLGEGYSYQPGDQSSTPVAGSGGGIPDVVIGAPDTVFDEDADVLTNGLNDVQVINDAIASLSSLGGWIHFLQGTYVIDALINWPQGVMFTGAGPGVSILRVKAGASISGIFELPTYAGNPSALGNREQVLENLTLDGNKSNGATVSTGLLWVQATAVTRNVRIRRCQFINATGAGIGGGSGNCLFTFEETEVAYNNSHGLDMQNASHHHNCWYHDNGGDGFQDLAHAGTQYFTNCRIYNNGGDGINVTGLLARARLIVLGCSIFGNGGLGINQGYLATPSIIVGNVVNDNTGPDIAVHSDSLVYHNITDDVPSPNTEVSIGDVPITAPQVQTFSLLGVIAVTTSASRFVAPRSGTIKGVRVACGVAPTGAAVIVDLNKNGNTAYTTQANRPTCPDGSNQGSETVPDVTSLADGDYLTVDIDQVGSTVAGEDISVMVDIAWDLTGGA